MPVSPPLIDRRLLLPSGAPSRSGLIRPGRVIATVASAVLRAAAAVAAGLLLVEGIALLLWAVTPGSGSDATGLLSGGVVAFAAGHFLPVSIGGVSVTVRPLLLTVIAVAVIASSAGRARPVRGRTLEALHGAIFALTYAVLVGRAAAALTPDGAVGSGLLAPLGVAVVGALLGITLHRTAWNRWWRHWAPRWLRAALRAGLAAGCVLLAAGALAVVIGLVTSLSDATAIAKLTAGSAGDGFGLLLLGLAFLPNAVVAGVGYVSGVGFTLGGGSFSPLVTHGTDLPAIPLLAAIPDGSVSRSALLAFVAPVAAAALIGVITCRMLDTRRSRMAAAALAAAVAGLIVAGLAAAARGGVAGGPWETTGVPVLLAGGVVTGALLVIGVAWAAVSGLRSVAWAPRRESTGVDADDGGDGDGSDDTDDASDTDRSRIADAPEAEAEAPEGSVTDPDDAGDGVGSADVAPDPVGDDEPFPDNPRAEDPGAEDADAERAGDRLPDAG